MTLFLSPTITQKMPLPPPHPSILFHKATKKAPRVISVPLMMGVLRCSNVAFSALLRITLQPFVMHSKESSATFNESSATSKREQWCIPLPLMQRSVCR